jgi:predicted transglutaminase-like cysteine proteinase
MTVKEYRMEAEAANREVSSKFKYVTDKLKYGFFETWSVIDISKPVWEGDCEDYSLTVLWLMSDKKKKTFLFNILLHPDYRMHFVRYKATKEGHAVLSYKDKFCDNIQQKWFTKKDEEYTRYNWKWPIFGFIVCINLVLGKIIKRVVKPGG